MKVGGCFWRCCPIPDLNHINGQSPLGPFLAFNFDAGPDVAHKNSYQANKKFFWAPDKGINYFILMRESHSGLLERFVNIKQNI